jgi:hypothetical protein
VVLIPTACIGIFGQSFATGVATASAVDVIKRELGFSGYTSVTTLTYTAGNTRVAEWWDGVNGKLGIHGQAAIDLIRATTVKPTHIVWMQGEADAYSPNDAQFRADTGNILYRLRNVSNSASPASVPVISHVVGRFVSAAQPGNQIVRSAQHRMAREAVGVRAINRLIDCFDLDILHDDPLNRKPGDRHLSPVGNAKLGHRVAHGILAATGLPSALPQLATSATVGGLKEVQITIGGGVSAPASPSLVALSTGASPLFIVASPTGLVATFDDDIPDGASITYPYGQMTTLDTSAMLKDAVGRTVPSFTLGVT